METPSIYVACLASYNDGEMFGTWIDATQDVDDIYEAINTMLAKSPVENAEEFAIHDYSGFRNLELSEYESIETVAQYAAFIDEHDDLGAALLDDYSFDEAERMISECYHGSFDNEVEFAEQLFDDCYSKAIPDNLLYYFDFEAFARDLFINDFSSVDASGQTHVFSNY